MSTTIIVIIVILVLLLIGTAVAIPVVRYKDAKDKNMITAGLGVGLFTLVVVLAVIVFYHRYSKGQSMKGVVFG